MPDRLTPEQRSRNMRAVRSKATKPEVLVRRWLWSHGYRYRLNVRSVPGSADIVMRKYRTAIFVNGCFWHQHRIRLESGEEVPCKGATVPKSRVDFWTAKFAANRARDERNYQALQAAGWQVIVLWECQLKPSTFELTMQKVVIALNENLLKQYKNQNTNI